MGELDAKSSRRLKTLISWRRSGSKKLEENIRKEEGLRKAKKKRERRISKAKENEIKRAAK